MDLTEAIGDGGRPLDSTHTTQTVSTKIESLKNKRAVVKRRITNTLKKLDSTIAQYGRKAIIRGYVNNLQEYLIEAKDLNDELVFVIPENEHEIVLNWYEEQLERIQEAKLEANAHLDDRVEESSNGLSSVKLSLSKTSTTARSSQTAEIRAKMTSAEIKAKQLALEEQRRMEKFENNWRLKESLNLCKTKVKGSNSRLEKEERLRKPGTRLHALQQKQQSLKKGKMKIMTLKLCLIDCLILWTHL
ncbi:tropomyosin Mac r 1.0101-like [Montipora foliosa]|uniref:tropomyosin Mac r 1.0101-like n=1 Tax=Montipora foliosa TaxID=591990 RepID=UPI0035F14185